MGVHRRSDRERRAMFMRMNNPNQRRSSHKPPPKIIRTSHNTPLPPNVSNFLSKKISENIKEGKPRNQAIAIAFSQTRKKFPEQSRRLTLPRNSPIDATRLRSFLISLVGLAITIRILRELRK